MRVFFAALLLVAPMGGEEARQQGLKSSPRGISPVSDTESRMRRLEELVQQQRWEQAARLTEELFPQESDNPVLHYWVGVVRWQLEEKIAAVQALRRAQLLGLDTALLHKTLGMAYYRMHQFRLFKDQMEQASAHDPGDHQPHYHLGRYLESVRNDFQRALVSFEKAIELSPYDAQSIYYKGYCLELLEREEEALRSYEASVQLLDNNTEAFSWPYQGMARIQLNRDIEQALGWATKAVDLQPELGSNHLVLAKIYERLGKLPEAVEELQVIVRLNPGHTGARYMLFRLYKKLGRPEEAQAELSIFKKLKAVYGEQ